MNYPARILGPESDTWLEVVLPSKQTYIELAAPPRISWNESGCVEPRLFRARLVRELPPEDGGPLLIYRVGAKDVLVD